MRSRLQQSLILCICQVIQNIFFKIRKKTNNGILSINSTEYEFCFSTSVRHYKNNSVVLYHLQWGQNIRFNKSIQNILKKFSKTLIGLKKNYS